MIHWANFHLSSITIYNLLYDHTHTQTNKKIYIIVLFAVYCKFVCNLHFVYTLFI